MIFIDPNEYLIYYKGPFDDVILARISDFLRNKFPESPKVCGTLFAIFVELAQNISRYSSEHNHFGAEKEAHGVGLLGISQNEVGYVLKASNLVEKINGEALAERCDTINDLDYAGLKELQKQIRALPLNEQQKGGNIGLIQIAMRSGHPVHVELVPAKRDEFVYVVITAVVPYNL